MASSSTAICVSYDYDVFLSFRGDDTRNNFTSHLYDALYRSGIKAFIDNKIDRGEEITTTIERVIESVKLSIIVFSPDYASSTFCLDELVKIMDCRESKDQTVLPIFYKMEPSEDAYGEAFAKHKAEFERKKRSREETIEQQLKKVKRWQLAFCKALNLGGWPIDVRSNEAKLIRKITREVLKRLNCEPMSQSKGEKLICASLVGQTAEDNFKKIWEYLMNDNITRVGIYGMGGVGKTTIATRINNELLTSANSFTHVCWVTVSKDLNFCKLQNEIAKTIKLDLSKEDDQRKRAGKLKEVLNTMKFVLILDDVWEAFDTDDVGIPHLVSGQKILLTSRSRRVCERMECQPIKLRTLSQEEALDLFMKESRNKINGSPQWRDIVHSIVKECGGLPLAIVVVARRMRGVVEIWEWRNTLRELQKPHEGENHEMEDKVFRPLKFSYDRLPNDKCQQCFLYCSLFPEDYQIQRNDLIMYWIGEGLIDELDSWQAELDKGHCMMDELINASLLEHNIGYGKEFIKMHDVIRDMAFIVLRGNSKSQDGLKLQVLSEETERCVNFKNVLVMEDSLLERGVPNLAPNYSKVSTLIFNRSLKSKLPRLLFANMQHLAVLDMNFQRNLELLPDSLNHLGNLRVLLLSNCQSLKYIPSLSGLKKLLHLDLSFTSLQKIPNGMERLINLRVLKLTWNRFAFFPSAVFLKKLSHLQILELEKVKVEADVLISLEKLETLRMVFNSLKCLKSYLKSGHWQRLEEYRIGFCQGNRVDEIIYGEIKYNARAYKKVMFLGDLGGQIAETGIVLPNYVQFLGLCLWNGPMLDVLMNGPFDNLQQLEIYGYGGKHLFTPALVQRVLLNVQTLHIRQQNLTDCRVEEIISPEEELAGEITNYSTIELPYLRCLRLERFTKLRSIYKGRMVCPSLELIEIDYCGKLERLPFCMREEEREKHNPIKLKVSHMPKQWWDSLQWDHPNAKTMYRFEGHSLFGSDLELDCPIWIWILICLCFCCGA